MCILALRPASADLRQLFIATRVYDGSTEDNNNKVLRIPLEGPDAGELLPFGGLADGVTSPSVIAVHPGTGRLYVGDHTTRQLLDKGHPKARLIRRETALNGLAVPLHPGAERYYREAGLLK